MSDKQHSPLKIPADILNGLSASSFMITGEAAAANMVPAATHSPIGDQNRNHLEDFKRLVNPWLIGRMAGPVKAYLRLVERWELTPQQGATLLGESDPSVLDDLRSGVAGLRTRDQADRVRYSLSTYSVVNRLLRDEAAERRWIRLRRPELGDKSLLETMLGGSIEDLLIAREYVEQYVNE